tara:strand:+ start:148 stop:630 length:483 start_codon:yes stop_codon:yes gene_type:complete
MGFTAAGISPTTVTTTQQAPLGFVLTVPDATTAGDSGYGTQEWVYVKTSAELTVGEVGCRAIAAISAPFHVGVGAATTTRAAAVGVAQHTIASGSYGFILRKGVGSVMADGSVTQGVDIMPAAAGAVTDLTGTAEHKVIGQAFATDAGTTLVLAMLDCGA